MSNQFDIVEAQDIEDAWAAEVKHRIDKIESGRATLIPAHQRVQRLEVSVG